MKIKQLFIVFLGACLLCSSLTGTAQASKWGDILGSIFSGSGSGSSSDYKYTRLVGKVLDGDKVPISGVLVTYDSNDGGSWSSHTDVNGNYRMTVPASCNGHITFACKEWRTIHEHCWTGSGDESVQNAYMYHDYITGKVTDRNRNPMHWVKLTFEADGGTKGVVTVYTDEKGNYKATLPVDGDYWVTISQDGYKTYRSRAYLKGDYVENYTMYEQ